MNIVKNGVFRWFSAAGGVKIGHAVTQVRIRHGLQFYLDDHGECKEIFSPFQPDLALKRG